MVAVGDAFRPSLARAPLNLIETYRELASTGVQFRGLSVLRYADDIGSVIRKHGAQTLLDYGAGGGDAYYRPHSIQHQWNLPRPVLYDPAFPEHDELPNEVFDGVICSDVLEHVEQAFVGSVVRDLFSHASKFVWASVCCRAAKKWFPQTGQNMHVTVQPFDWWRNRFVKAARPGVAWYLVESK